ncbi:mediator of RNA polymerase II transcription subunit 26 [Elgaria multicarinata webbii]|uniref:mediator of RNA polymerase II transcription subunit 26 n=1 Tax=Elgaria multicarinata webbii TaxID=159646 RepID=UPI002FCD4B85
MTAAPGPSPQQIRDRLLQAIDPHSNIHNMVAVMEVISSLEKYPITKEALEETRLGKLINDVRKKTKNEELAKRAKKLLRNWQKLIEPVTPSEAAPPRGLPHPPGSANGGAHNCRVEMPPAPLLGSKPVPDAKNRNDVQKLRSPKPGNRKRKGKPRDGPPLPLPLPKAPKDSYEALQNSSPPPTNGIGGSPESFPSPPDASLAPGPEGGWPEPGESDKLGKIPINAVRPHTSSPGLFKPSGAASLIKAAVLQQHEEAAAEEAGPAQPRSPRCASFSLRGARLEAFAQQQATCSPKGGTPTPSPRPPHPEAPAALPLSSSSLPPPPPLPAVQLPLPPLLPLAKRLEAGQAAPLLHGPEPQAAAESQLRLAAAGASPGSGAEPSAPFSPDVSKMDSDGTASGSDGKKKKSYRPKDYVVNLDGQVLEGGVKSVRLKKKRRLTFDPMTGEIKPLVAAAAAAAAQRDSLPGPVPALAEPPHRTGAEKPPELKPPLQSPFEQTNWKELSRNEIIQSYLNRQSSLLSSSGAQTPGAHYFMSEYLKQEESTRREARKSHVLAPHSSKPSDLPGVTREVTSGDLDRICGQRWPGVNGCYDTQGHWYDWTQCISLDPHGDDGRLNLLPYVCLD